MTYREKLAMEHPDCVGDFEGGCKHCPHTYGYAIKDNNVCDTMSCYDCWGREIPEEESCEPKKYNPIQKAYDLMVGFCHENKTTDLEEVIGYLGEALATEEGANAIRVSAGTPGIKDSGDRTEFATGAVRDMREGKGRCDLMPLEVVSRMFSENSMFEDPIIRGIKLFMSNDNDTEYLYHTLVVFCGKQYDGFAPTMFLEAAKHFEEGAKKYGENNWQKGIPVHCYIDSAVRHYLKWLRGDKDEPHDRAFVWNLMCCIWEVDYRPKEENDALL